MVRGIRLKLIAILLVAALIPLLLGVTSLRYFGSRYFVSQQGELFENAAAYTAGGLSEGLEAQAEALSGWVSLSTLARELTSHTGHGSPTPDPLEIQTLERDWATAEATSPLVSSVLTNPVANILHTFQARNPLLVEILVTDDQGRIAAGTNKTTDYWQADEAWWQQARALGPDKAWVEGIQFDESAGIYSIDMAVPIYESDRRVGVLKAVINASPLMRASAIRTDDRGAVRIVLLETGEILARLTGAPLAPFSERFVPVNRHESGADVLIGPTGEQILAGFAQVRGTRTHAHPALRSDVIPMTVVVYQPLAQVLAPLHRQLLLVSLLGTGVVLAFGLAGYYIAKNRLVRPLRVLQTAAHDIAATARLGADPGTPEPPLSRQRAEARLRDVEHIATRDEIQDLARDFSLMSRRVLDYHQQLEQEIAGKTEELRQDLVMARHFQEALLPRTIPPVPQPAGDERFRLEFYHVYKPVLSVGGDFFDVHKIDPARAGVFIADVMGHGSRSALVTAILHTMLQEAGAMTEAPGELLTQINTRFAKIVQRMEDILFVSAFYMCLDTQAGTASFASAGHPSPLLASRTDGTIHPLLRPDQTGPALGLIDEAVYTSHTRRLQVSDAVLLYTDGALEAASPFREEFGENRLRHSILTALDNEEDDLPGAILQSLHDFMDTEPARDDICLVSAEVLPLQPEP